MRRQFYILVGAIGILGVVGSVVAAAVLFVPPGRAGEAYATEALVGFVGACLAYAGLTLGRQAGEFDVARYRRRPSNADDGQATPELAFACPTCGRGYRAGGRSAGRAFVCRGCGANFDIPGPTATARTVAAVVAPMRMPPGPTGPASTAADDGQPATAAVG